MGVLTTALAAVAATPSTVLAVLVDHARSASSEDLLQALVRNPSLDLDTATDLAAGAGHIGVRALLDRADLTAEAAVRALGGGPDEVTATLALELVPDPTGHLADHLLSTGTSARLWEDMVTNTDLPPRHRRAAALRLAAHTTPGSGAANTIWDYARLALGHATTAAAHRAAVQHLHDLADAAPHLAGQLAKISASGPEPLTPGSLAWLTYPGTTTDDVLAWLDGAPPARWVHALSVCRDPDGALAAAALATHPTSRVLRALLSGPAPVVIAQRALAALRRLQPGVEPLTPERLRLGGDPGLAVSLILGGEPEPWQLSSLLCRPDLTTAHVGQILTAATASVPRPAVLEVLLAVATHPSATPGHARHAAARARAIATRVTSSPETDSVVALLGDLAAGGPGQVAATCALPTLGRLALVAPAVEQLMVQALTSLLPDPSAEQARVLVGLAEGFGGTLVDLVDTVTTVTV